MKKYLIAFLFCFLSVPVFARMQGEGTFIKGLGKPVTVAAGGGVQADVIQSTKAFGGFPTSSLKVQLANNGTSGSELLLYAASSASGGQALSTPTGWTLLASTGNTTTSGILCYLWYRRNFSVGVTSATVATQSTNNATIHAFMIEYSNLNASPANSAGVGKGTGVTASTNVVTSIGNCIVVAGMTTEQGSNTSITANNSFTLRQSYTDGVNQLAGGIADLGAGANLSAGTYTPSFTAANAAWYVVGGGFCQ